MMEIPLKFSSPFWKDVYELAKLRNFIPEYRRNLSGTNEEEIQMEQENTEKKTVRTRTSITIKPEILEKVKAVVATDAAKSVSAVIEAALEAHLK